MTTRDELIDWLRDAYAMERGLEITLRKQSESDEVLPVVRERAGFHLEETRRHAEEVRRCLETLGADVSSIKAGVAQTVETFKGFGTRFARDERVKDTLAAYASEHFEIACYKALRAAAVQTGDHAIVEMCDRILPDEERMAEWLDQNLPVVVTEYLQQEAATH